jgi:SprT protein
MLRAKRESERGAIPDGDDGGSRCPDPTAYQAMNGAIEADDMTTSRTTDHLGLHLTMKQAMDRSRYLLHEAEQWLELAMPDTEIRFDLGGTSAGQARVTGTSTALIRYNPTLLCLHPTEFIKETVAHEVAHVVAFVRHGPGIRPHGPEWKGVMHRFGVEPSRCHGYDVSWLRTRSLQRFAYSCGCRTHQISSIRHNRVRNHGIIYLCRFCRQPLRPAPDPGPGGYR